MSLTYRRAGPNDTRACHELLWRAASDLGIRHGTPLSGSADDWWTWSQAQYALLSHSYAEWWVAEDPVASRLVGYARSIERVGLFELTEFFVDPGQQAQGIGRTLLDLAFPLGRGEVRSIIATTDVRALARYYGTGTAAHFPFLTLAGVPRADAVNQVGLECLRIGERPFDLAEVINIEREVLEFPRGEEELRWLLSAREGYLYKRGGRLLAFSFVGAQAAGPIAALNPADLPEVLLHVESRAHALGAGSLNLDVPSVNETVVRHLLSRGYQFDPWINLLMASRPFGQFDRFIPLGPPLFL